MTEEPVTGTALSEPVPVADQAVARAADAWLHPLEPYGPSKALHEMTRRIMLFDTGKVKMNPTEAAHLAQVAASAWLNPFSGEIWGWVDSYAGSRRLNIMPGRRGLIRHAKEQAREEGDKFYPEYEAVKAMDLRQQYNVEEGDAAFICRLRSVREIETWNDSLRAAGEAGLQPSDVKELVGPRPFTFGLGIMRKADIDRWDGKGMTPTERSQKRAYMMALKQKYVLPLAHAIGHGGETIDDYVAEGDWREVTEPDKPAAELPAAADEPAAEPPPAAEQPAAEDQATPGRPYQPDVLRERFVAATERFAGTRKDEKIGGMELWQMVAWQLREAFAGDDDQELKYHAALQALSGKSSSKDLTGAQCRAVLQWLDPQEREGPGAGLRPSPAAVTEADALYIDRMGELGRERLAELEAKRGDTE